MPDPHLAGLSRSATVTAQINWDDASLDTRLDGLYVKATKAQWSEEDLDWSVGRPLGEIAYDFSDADRVAMGRSPFAGGSADRWVAYRQELQAWLISQILYGEQGALVITSRLAETMPDTASKCVAASQVGDEARHVRVFQRYLAVCGRTYEPTPEIGELLGLLLAEPRWDVLFLGMQIVIEGVALSILRAADLLFSDPLLASIARRVARDESRHLGFGVVSLDRHLRELTSSERADRQEFVAEAVRLMAKRFLFDGVWERLGVPVAQGRSYAQTDQDMVALRRVLFYHVTSALRRLGLWDGLAATFDKLDLVVR